LVILVAVGLAIRLEGIGNELIDHHTFRQGTEAMMARDFHRNGFDLLHPHIYGYSNGPTVFVNEFPLYPAIVASLYRVYGEREILGRIISLLASLGTGLLVYFLLRLFHTGSAPFFGSLLFMLSPLGSYVGRCYLRHPLAFFLMILGFYMWLHWVRRPTWSLWLGVWFAITASVMTNFANAYIGLPMLVALLTARGRKGLADHRPWTLALGILLPTFAWVCHAFNHGAWFMGGPGGNKQRDLGRFLSMEWLNAEFFGSLGYHLWVVLLTPAGCILAVFGLLLYWRSPFAWLVRSWALAAFLYLCFDHYAVYIVVHDYYFLHLLIPGCLAFGMAAEFLCATAKRWASNLGGSSAQVIPGATGVVLLLLTVWSYWQFDRPLKESFLCTEYGWIQQWLPASAAVRELTEPDDILLVDQPDDSLIYYCDRPGWVSDMKHLSERVFQNHIREGVDYLLVTTYEWEGDRLTGYRFDREFEAAPWVRAHCPVAEDGPTYQIIDLRPGRKVLEREDAIDE